MSKLITAVTKLDPSYPGFVNVTREDDGFVVLTVRGDPKKVDGVYICGYARDRGSRAAARLAMITAITTATWRQRRGRCRRLHWTAHKS